MIKFSEFLIERNIKNSVSVDVYHGTGKEFNEFSQKQARLKNDHMGGGIAYFTTNKDVAEKYAKNASKSIGSTGKYVYHASLNMNNVFDVDHEFTGPKLIRILPHESKHEDFARGAGLLNAGTDKYDILSKLKSGNISLTGDQVYRGLSYGNANTSSARNHLIKKGYDGLRYNGGANMNQEIRHDVYIPYNSNSISIKKVEKVE